MEKNIFKKERTYVHVQLNHYTVQKKLTSCESAILQLKNINKMLPLINQT